jgi:predicted kinase
MKRLIIMRGIPGTGKSTYVRLNYPDATVCSADDYFDEVAALNGTSYEEEFQPWLMGKAHQHCWYEFIHAVCYMSEPLVVVDNTNTNKWEYENYIFLTAGVYDVTIVDIPFDPDLAEVYCERTVHGVPLESMQRLIANYEH